MKKYELTQEQIEKLAEKKHAKELLQEFIPEAFTKLQINKWYKRRHKKALFYVINLPNDECHLIKVYGFDNGGDWMHHESPQTYPDNEVIATEEEVREALINEAKKRGFNNIGILKIKSTVGGISNGYHTTNNAFYYDYKGNTLRLDGVVIFNNGVWAEIIEEPKETDPTEEEIKRVLNYLLKNGEKLHNEI